MKNRAKFLVTTIIGIITAATLSAQTTTSTTREAEFGVKGGFNMSNMYTENADDENIIYGFNAGVYGTFPLTEHIAIQPELYFTTKGSELDYNNNFVTGSAKFRLEYIQLPVMIKFNLTDNFNVHFGPYGAYLVGAKIKSENDQNIFEFEEELNTDDFEKFEFGLSLGIGFDFDPLSIGLRYDYGLTTVGKEQNIMGTNYVFPDAKNSLLNLYATIKLN